MLKVGRLTLDFHDEERSYWDGKGTFGTVSTSSIRVGRSGTKNTTVYETSMRVKITNRSFYLSGPVTPCYKDSYFWVSGTVVSGRYLCLCMTPVEGERVLEKR